MPCNHPLAAWRPRKPNENGRYAPTFDFNQADTSQKLELPCGHCIGCRLERARQWAMRMMHEKRNWRWNYFATLTYDDDHLPKNYSLRPEDFVKFMKRLRHQHQGVRFYQCGEYGERTLRPHHHAILFNCNLQDLREIPRARDAHTLFRSEALEAVWQQGTVTVGELTFESAAYAASYITKKITGPDADEHYQGRVPEYSTMSRRPGIGKAYFTEYRDELDNHDTVVVRGLTMRPPRYYDYLRKKEDPDAQALIDQKRNEEEFRRLTHRQRLAREANVLGRRGLTSRGNL